MTALSILWFFLVFLLIAGYFVLDGFDLGAGILYPFIAKDTTDKMIVRRALGPVWDGNEVWLLTAGGALFAAFPDAYATTFSGFYLAIMLVLFALIVRAVSFEFWAADTKWRKVWDICFFLGSLLPALLFGVAIGNVIAGIPMDVNGNYIGLPLLGLISPFTLLCGVLGLVMFIAAGACWLALKAPLGSSLQKRAFRLRFPFQLASLIVFVLASALIFTTVSNPIFSPEMTPWCYVVLVLFLLALFCAIGFSRRKTSSSDLQTFLCQSAASFFLPFLVAFSMFPNLVNATPVGPLGIATIGEAVNIANAGASELSLTCMTVILCIGLPFVLVYHVIIYRTFRGRIKPTDLAD